MSSISILARYLFQKRRVHQTGFLVALAVWCSALAPAGVQAAEPVVLGVHPYLSAPEIITRFTPLAEQLAAALNRPVTISVSPDYDSHVKRIAESMVDIAYIGPAAYVALTDAHGPQTLLARQTVNGVPEFCGYIIVRNDSHLDGVKDLKGKSFAFGDEQSTMSHLVPNALMAEARVTKQDLAHHAFVGSHENVALSVLAGAFDAGGVKEEVFHKYRDKGLRALAKSPPVSEHLFVASARLSNKETEVVRETLLSLAARAQGHVALKSIKSSVDGLIAVSDTDYDPLRKMIVLSRAEP